MLRRTANAWPRGTTTTSLSMRKGVSLQSLGASQVSQHSNISVGLGHSRGYLVTESLLQRDIDAGICRKPAGKNLRKVLFQRSRI